MMRDWMKFCEIISQVELTRLPKHEKLSLRDSVAQPVETHVHGLQSFLFHGIICDSRGGLVICDERRGGLGMTEFRKRDNEGNGLSGVKVSRPHFGLTGRYHDISDYLAFVINRTII